MVIYYNKVTETVTGTGIINSIRTDYEFDNSRCIHELGAPSRRKVPDTTNDITPQYSTEPTPTSMFSMILGETIPYNAIGNLPHYGIPPVGISDQDKFEKLFCTKSTYTGFSERISPAPLLVKKISYEYRDGGHKPAETVEYYHSSARHFVWCTGRYVQGNVYKSSFGKEYGQSFD